MERQIEKFISRKEVMEMLKVGPTTTGKYIRDKKLPMYRVTRRILFKESEVIAAIRCNEKKND